jgi:hypothetical protein
MTRSILPYNQMLEELVGQKELLEDMERIRSSAMARRG